MYMFFFNVTWSNQSIDGLLIVMVAFDLYLKNHQGPWFQQKQSSLLFYQNNKTTIQIIYILGGLNVNTLTAFSFTLGE